MNTCAGGCAGHTAGLSRRGFMERCTLAAIGAVLAGCSDGLMGPGVPTGGPYEVDLAAYPALAHVGGVARVDLGGGQVVGVGRTGPDSFAAYALGCTHEGTAVRASGDGWVCPSHGAAFDTAGRVTAGPANRPLREVPVTFEASTNLLTVNTVAGAGLSTGAGEQDDDDEGDDRG